LVVLCGDACVATKKSELFVSKSLVSCVLVHTHLTLPVDNTVHGSLLPSSLRSFVFMNLCNLVSTCFSIPSTMVGHETLIFIANFIATKQTEY
jgi:hypothetical protein